MEKTNEVFLVGELKDDLVYSHSTYSENFYSGYIETKRSSGVLDILPITVPEIIIRDLNLSKGMLVSIKGQFRSHNELIDNKSRLVLEVFVKEIEVNPPYDIGNEIHLVGTICKPTVYRVTPLNRQICDIFLAVNRNTPKSDYIPCVAWSRVALMTKDMPVGTKISIVGRIQSRKYYKKLDENTSVEKIAYEVSINKVLLYEEPCK